MGDWVPSGTVAVKALSVLGSTGSIGTQTLEIVEEFPQRFRVVALTAGPVSYTHLTLPTIRWV